MTTAEGKLAGQNSTQHRCFTNTWVRVACNPASQKRNEQYWSQSHIPWSISVQIIGPEFVQQAKVHMMTVGRDKNPSDICFVVTRLVSSRSRTSSLKKLEMEWKQVQRHVPVSFTQQNHQSVRKNFKPQRQNQYNDLSTSAIKISKMKESLTVNCVCAH